MKLKEKIFDFVNSINPEVLTKNFVIFYDKTSDKFLVATNTFNNNIDIALYMQSPNLKEIPVFFGADIKKNDNKYYKDMSISGFIKATSNNISNDYDQQFLNSFDISSMCFIFGVKKQVINKMLNNIIDDNPYAPIHIDTCIDIIKDIPEVKESYNNFINEVKNLICAQIESNFLKLNLANLNKNSAMSQLNF